MKIKILNIIDSLNIGGAESLLKNFIIDSKDNDDFEIELCVLYSEGLFYEDIKKAGVTIFNLNLRFKYNFLGIFKILRLIQKEKYRIVHVHLFPADFFVSVASLFLGKGIKFIFTEHSIYNRRRALRIFKILDSFTYGKYNKIICVSQHVKDSLEKWLPFVSNKTVIIRNAIPINVLPGKQLEKMYDVLFVGRLEKVKGIDILLRATEYIMKTYSRNIKIGIVGTGTLLRDLKKLSVDLRVIDNVEFLGPRQDILRLIDQSSVFVLPSRWEGLSISILESMSRGVPAIATSVGGIPEIISDGNDGLLVPPEDPVALADALLILLNDEKLRARLGRNAYEKVRRDFSIDRYTQDILNLYRHILEDI
jgi:glycosyltransferase involved in cell wall biosynthesis